MITLIKNGEVYSPENEGKKNILLIHNKIVNIGEIEEDHLPDRLGIDVEVIDAEGCVVTPGFIDPHVHLIGGGGEGGFATRTPEIQLSEIIRAGVTTVVGCLGTDGTTRHMTSLLAKARGLEEEGVSTFIYTGNYHVPTPTITSCVKDDVIIIDKVIGAGEIALSDSRSAQPSVHEIAKLIAEARIGGLLSGKAGVTHFHIGPGKHKLHILHQVLEEYEVPAQKIYCTHISRSQGLMDEAIALSHKGAYVDITAGELSHQWIRYYHEHGGNLSQVTMSSDGNGSLPEFDEHGNFIRLGVASPYTLYEQVKATVLQEQLPLEQVLPLVTSNTATALELKRKGRIKEGYDADVCIFTKDQLDLLHVFANGKQMVRRGEVIVKGTFEK